jgi:hypothetical protein
MANVQVSGKSNMEETAMNANHLLLWMSARQHGTWIQFKSAIEELSSDSHEVNSEGDLETDQIDSYGLPIHQVLRLNLQCLSHAEFFSRGNEAGWAIVPPSIAVHIESGKWIGILCGARSPMMINMLKDTFPIAIETHAGDMYPDPHILVTEDEGLLLTLSEDLHLYVQLNAPMSMLVSLPPVASPAYLCRCPIPIGKDWKIERFSTSLLRFKPSSIAEVNISRGGLFHFALAYRHLYFFCDQSGSYEIQPRIGKYLSISLRHRKVIQYTKESRDMVVPATLRLPMLIERALVLFSGIPPIYDVKTGLLHYQQIPEDIVKLASTLLGQEA